MKRVCLAMILALMAGQALAQEKPIQKYGEPDPDKTASEIDAEKRAERAYKRSLSNVPDSKAPTDPWGTVRGGEANKSAAKSAAKTTAPKPAAKPAPKHSKPAAPAPQN